MKLIQIVHQLKCHQSPSRFSAAYYSARFLHTKTLVNNTSIMGAADSFRTYQEMVYIYLTGKNYWKSVVKQLTAQQSESEFNDIHKIFMTNDVVLSAENSKSALRLSKLLPSYIATMKNREVSHQIVTRCDDHCSEMFDLHFSPVHQNRASSFDFIHAWLNYFHPHFSNIQQLTCFGKLLQWRCREVLTNQGDQADNDFQDKLVHLAFFAGMGRKNFDNHEILNQLATFCDMNNEITYQALNPFDMAILCESFFKGGIRIEDEKSLDSIATTLCTFLQEILLPQNQPSQHFNPFVIISLLKILRQINFIHVKLLKLLSELILSPLCGEKVRDIRFIVNVAGAFSFPGCQKYFPAHSSSGDDLSIEKILQRMDNLVLNILQEEQSTATRRKIGSEKKDAQVSSVEQGLVVESRLKDISKYLWISASLGYQMPSTKTYIKDLSHRLDRGQFTKNPEDGIDSLLALAIMNQYPDSGLVLKILQSTDFRSSVKVNCSNRHKGRMGLFLTSLRMERASLWNQLSPRDETLWFEAVRTPFTMTEANTWSQSHRRVKPLKVPGIREDFKPHTELLNACMDASNQIFSQRLDVDPAANSASSTTFSQVGKVRDDGKQDCDKATPISLTNSNNRIKKSESSARLIALLLDSEMDVPYQNQRAQVYLGYSVPFLFIPGLKIVFPVTRQTVYLEVLDDVGLSSSYHGFKMRLMETMKYTYVKVTRDEIQDLDNKELIKLLGERLKKFL